MAKNLSEHGTKFRNITVIHASKLNQADKAYFEKICPKYAQDKNYLVLGERVIQINVLLNIAELIAYTDKLTIFDIEEINDYLAETIKALNKPNQLINLIGFRVYLYLLNDLEISRYLFKKNTNHMSQTILGNDLAYNGYRYFKYNKKYNFDQYLIEKQPTHRMDLRSSAMKTSPTTFNIAPTVQPMFPNGFNQNFTNPFSTQPQQQTFGTNQQTTNPFSTNPFATNTTSNPFTTTTNPFSATPYNPFVTQAFATQTNDQKFKF